MAQADEYARLIEAHIPDSQARVEGADGKFEAVVISDAFAGRNMLAKHRMVYAALDERIKAGDVHAVSIRAYTTDEWAQAGGER